MTSQIINLVYVIHYHSYQSGYVKSANDFLLKNDRTQEYQIFLTSDKIVEQILGNHVKFPY